VEPDLALEVPVAVPLPPVPLVPVVIDIIDETLNGSAVNLGIYTATKNGQAVRRRKPWWSQG
jgi:hypothetical protein